MPRYTAVRDPEPRGAACIGVLLCNLGTPAAPTLAAVRRYLAEFLADPRLVELPRWLWLPILHGVILNTRPRRSAHAYARIWTAAGSPLLVNSQRLCHAVAERLETQLPGRVRVVLGMRYGAPSIAQALGELRAANAGRNLVLPLYPQYSATSSASVFDAVTAELSRWRRVPELRWIADYHEDDGYLAALAASVREFWRAHGRGERLVMSFHGIPLDYARAGDPYFDQCQATARALAERLQLGTHEWMITFQSRFGPRQWLQPYTDASLQTLAREGVRHVDLLCPGFAADCLETLEEIAMQNAERFVAAGGEALRYIPALNDRPDHAAALADLALRHLRGWPEAA